MKNKTQRNMQRIVINTFNQIKAWQMKKKWCSHNQIGLSDISERKEETKKQQLIVVVGFCFCILDCYDAVERRRHLNRLFTTLQMIFKSIEQGYLNNSYALFLLLLLFAYTCIHSFIHDKLLYVFIIIAFFTNSFFGLFNSQKKKSQAHISAIEHVWVEYDLKELQF